MISSRVTFTIGSESIILPSDYSNLPVNTLNQSKCFQVSSSGFASKLSVAVFHIWKQYLLISVQYWKLRLGLLGEKSNSNSFPIYPSSGCLVSLNY